MKLILITFAVSTFAITLLSFDQSFDLKASVKRGKTIYETSCITCHMAEGTGLEGVFPPLVKSNMADKNRLIKVIVQGMRGPSKVNGVDYNGEMAAIVLTNEQAADVANYVRNSWGNKAPAILPSQVQPALKVQIKGYQKY
ncbi:MAG: cytochrome c [Chitinophagaceae bacterium]|nr:cytochrome c [Chitinophagaceae bacterium]